MPEYKLSRRAAQLLFAGIVLSIFVASQPWTYNFYGFDEVAVQTSRGELRFELFDQAGKKNRKYCLFTHFRSADEPGRPIAITLDSIGSDSAPMLRSSIFSSGVTTGFPNPEAFRSYFEGQSIGRIVFPTDEQLHVTGRLTYQGATLPFSVSMKLRHWEKSRKAIRFCV
jgi:hypothetical protein